MKAILVIDATVNRIQKGFKKKHIKKFSATFLARIITAASSILIIALIGQILGAEGVGQFAILQSILIGFSVISRYGMDNTLLKKVSATDNSEEHHKYLFWAVKRCAIASILFALLIYVNRGPISKLTNQDEIRNLLVIVSLSLLPFSLNSILSGYYKGKKRPALATLIDSGGTYSMALIILAPTTIFKEINIESILLTILFCSLVILIITVYSLHKETPFKFKFTQLTPPEKHLLEKDSLNYLIISLNQLTQTSLFIIIPAIYLNGHDVGILKSAERISQLIAFSLIVVNTVIPPYFSRAFTEKDYGKVKDAFLVSCALPLAISTPIIGACIILPELILGLFGNEFKQGSDVLLIITFGQIINIATGASTYFLCMINKENIVRNITIISSLVGVICLNLLTSNFGIYGAAATYSITILITNLSAFVYALIYLNKISIHKNDIS